MSSAYHSRLIAIMQRELESQNLQLSQYGRQLIEQAVSHGAQRMRINKITDHPSYTLRAEQNLRSLIRYLCDYSRDLETYPKLSDAHLNAAMTTSRTFWPFTGSE